MRKLPDILAEQAKNELDDRDLTSRTDQRKERHAREAAFIELARSLVELNEKRLSKLSLPELLLDAVLEARATKSAPAVARALKRVRKELRDTDWEAVQRRLDLLRDPGRALAPGALEAWRDRIASGDASALDEFVSNFPAADRQRLRALARNLSRAAETARSKALATLAGALREAMLAPTAQAASLDPPEA